MSRCLICFKDVYTGTSIVNYFKGKDLICGLCRNRMQVINRVLIYKGRSITALYVYDRFLESLLFQFKEGRDIALKEIFFYFFYKEIFDKFKGYTIVYMPSSLEKIKERGFFPLEEMMDSIKINKVQLFEKKTNVKQSLQAFKDRAKISEVIQLKKGIVIPDTKLLLVDDVCTSGSTIGSAFRLLDNHNHKVVALVLCVHPLFVESCD